MTQPIVPPEGGLRQLVALTQYVVRGTRSVAQDIVCPRRGLRRYVTLTQDIDPPKGGNISLYIFLEKLSVNMIGWNS